MRLRYHQVILNICAPKGEETMSQVVGIDLGTTNSAIAFMEGDRPEVIVAVQEAPRRTPYGV
jgi:molecular chaperone DnaK (HSP70)